LLSKVEDLNDVDDLLYKQGVAHSESVLTKSDTCILYTFVGKVIDVDFKSEATVLREKQLISFA
jgi:hypothetical protein